MKTPVGPSKFPCPAVPKELSVSFLVAPPPEPPGFPGGLVFPPNCAAQPPQPPPEDQIDVDTFLIPELEPKPF